MSKPALEYNLTQLFNEQPGGLIVIVGDSMSGKTTAAKHIIEIGLSSTNIDTVHSIASVDELKEIRANIEDSRKRQNSRSDKHVFIFDEVHDIHNNFDFRSMVLYCRHLGFYIIVCLQCVDLPPVIRCNTDLLVPLYTTLFKDLHIQKYIDIDEKKFEENYKQVYVLNNLTSWHALCYDLRQNGANDDTLKYISIKKCE